MIKNKVTNMDGKSWVQGSIQVGEHMVQEHIVVEKYDAEEEGSETSCLPKTSQSVSKTLGTKDTPTNLKSEVDGKGLERKKEKDLCVFFFKTTEIPIKRSHCIRWKTNWV